MTKKLNLQQQIIELRQLEDALRLEAKEKLNKLKRVQNKRIKLEKLLNAQPN